MFNIFNVLHMMDRMYLCAFCRCNSCISHKRYLFYCPLGRDRPGIISVSLHLYPLDPLQIGWMTWAWPFQWRLQLLEIQLAWLASGSWGWWVLCWVLPGKATSIQFAGIPLLVDFSPKDIGIVSRHVHNVVENNQGPTGSLRWQLYVAVTLSRLSTPPLVEL